MIAKLPSQVRVVWIRQEMWKGDILIALITAISPAILLLIIFLLIIASAAIKILKAVERLIFPRLLKNASRHGRDKAPEILRRERFQTVLYRCVRRNKPSPCLTREG